MLRFCRRLTPFFLLLLAFGLIEAGIVADSAEARARSGGRSFSRSTPMQSPAPASQQMSNQKPSSGFGRGLAGGLLGGAIGGLLFGSLFGMGGSGMGILPLLILAGGGFLIYRRLSKSSPSSSFAGGGMGRPFAGMGPQPPALDPVAEGLAMIRRSDPGFDEKYFLEVASDVFFKVQAGWMRRDLSVFAHLLGPELIAEYEQAFAELKRLGRLNKLESISIRQVAVVGAGSEQGEDYCTVLFTANLLDYTVDERSGDLLAGSMDQPVKFAEEWTWTRPVATEEWRLAAIQALEG